MDDDVLHLSSCFLVLFISPLPIFLEYERRKFRGYISSCFKENILRLYYDL